MPLFRRIPKRGFSNAPFANHYCIVNLSSLEKAFENGTSVDPAALASKRLIAHDDQKVKILGSGKLSKNLTVSAHAFSKAAAEQITRAGGQSTVLK